MNLFTVAAKALSLSFAIFGNKFSARKGQALSQDRNQLEAFKEKCKRA